MHSASLPYGGSKLCLIEADQFERRPLRGVVARSRQGRDFLPDRRRNQRSRGTELCPQRIGVFDQAMVAPRKYIQRVGGFQKLAMIGRPGKGHAQVMKGTCDVARAQSMWP